MASSITTPQIAYAADKAIVVSKGTIAKTKLFTADYSDEVVAPMTTLQIPVYDGKASTFDKENNNYCTTDGTVKYVPVTFDKHFKSTFSFDDLDSTKVSTRAFWDNAGQAAGRALARTIEQQVALLIKNWADGEPEGESITYADATYENVAEAIMKACNTYDLDISRSVLVCEPKFYGKLLGLLPANIYGDGAVVRDGMIPGLFGLKGVIQVRGIADASHAGTLAVVVQDDALIIAGRAVPVGSPKMYEEVGVTVDDDSNIPVGIRVFGNACKGENYFTLETLFGVKLRTDSLGTIAKVVVS